MPSLTRTVRFAINPPALRIEPTNPDPNGFAGTPSMRGLGRHYEIRIRCDGDPDPLTGYLLDIKQIDRAVRGSLIPIIQHACDAAPESEPVTLMPALARALREALPTAATVRWCLTPYYSLEMPIHASIAADTGVILRQKFDFAASHRLHVPSLSEEENRRCFGKCNHPGGHGHNYQFEPCVALALETGSPAARTPVFNLQALERLAESLVIARFDHKHLNTDTAEFRDGSGLNPTVENIARVCYELLSPAIQSAGADLHSVTVWETDRTSATYPA
jgi:6-pyruvoyltetrahydropterin/6-carboxytetrahydropterin synthase